MSTPEITAEAIIAAADAHGFHMRPGNATTLDVEGKLCCVIGGAALLLEPRLSEAGGSRKARMLVEKTIGVAACNGIEHGFEGWTDVGMVSFDPAAYRRYYAIGKAAAEIVASRARET